MFSKYFYSLPNEIGNAPVMLLVATMWLQVELSAGTCW